MFILVAIHHSYTPSPVYNILVYREHFGPHASYSIPLRLGFDYATLVPCIKKGLHSTSDLNPSREPCHAILPLCSKLISASFSDQL
jgi:hypothetical protein